VGAGADVQEHTGTHARKHTSTKRGEDAKRTTPPAGDGRSRLHCLLAADLHRWLRIQAIDEGRDMGDIVADALERYRATIKPAKR
jgi:hypothetical protein